MISSLRRSACCVLVAVLAACSGGGSQTSTTLLPTTGSQSARSAFVHGPRAINAYLVFTPGGAFTGNCNGTPTGISDNPIESISFAFSKVAVGDTNNNCSNSPGGFTSTTPVATAPPTVKLTDKGCFPYAVNDNNLAVGGTGASAGKISQAAYLKGTHCVALPNLPGDGASRALGVNDDGTIVGYSMKCGCGGMKHPVEWINHKVYALSTGAGVATGINKNGQIIGTIFDAWGNPNAVIWTSPGKFKNIGALVPGSHLNGGQINDLGDATMFGTVPCGSTTRPAAFLFNASTGMATEITAKLPNTGPITPVGLDNFGVVWGIAESIATREDGKGARSPTTSLAQVSNNTATDMQKLVPPNVALRPESITTGLGGSGFAVSASTGIITTVAQVNPAPVKGGAIRRHSPSMITRTVFLVPPGCVPPSLRLLL